jgi:hypothetical protein
MTLMELITEFILGRPEERTEKIFEDVDLTSPDIRVFAFCDEELVIKVFRRELKAA